MAKSKPEKLDAPEGYCYTESQEVEIRSFHEHLRLGNATYIDKWQLWTLEKKDEWQKSHPQEELTATA